MIRSMLFHTGRYMIMLASTLRRPANFRMYWKEIVRQMYDIGIGSLIIVVLISVFIGAVSAVQFNYQMGGTFIPKRSEERRVGKEGRSWLVQKDEEKRM